MKDFIIIILAYFLLREQLASESGEKLFLVVFTDNEFGCGGIC
jgi:hypothetical protein